MDSTGSRVKNASQNLSAPAGPPYAQVHVQTGFECLGGWRLYNLPGQLMPVPGYSHSKKVFPDVESISVCAHCLWCCESYWICKCFVCSFCFPDLVRRSGVLEESAGSKLEL